MKELPANLPKWSRDFKLADLYLDKIWDEMPGGPGIYVVLSGRPINRAGGRDPSGILYVGQTSIVRNRLYRFLEAGHSASDFLWSNPEVARLILQTDLSSSEQVDTALGNLWARVASPLLQNLLTESERAVIWAYTIRYGEPPPLNSALPRRWGERPKEKWLKWARTGIAVGIS
jgi:hypothetical protein